nr:MAG TPA_asm: hypothetical protein [Caudoviricetes sp.]DAZ57792.1 MAG TPA: hypothetical protein [Caudoviricetes sp.]
MIFYRFPVSRPAARSRRASGFWHSARCTLQS